MKLLTGFVAACAVLGLLATGTVWAGEGEGGSKAPKPSTFRGELTKIEGKSLTITAKGESAVKEQVVTVDDSTKILLEGDPVDAPAGEDGKTRKKPSYTDGKIDDLKVGQKVSASFNADGLASQIIVHKAPAPKASGEGSKEG